MAHVGQDVFTIGHPKAYLWSFGQGVVSQIRPDYEWRYQDGIPRSATAIQTRAPINPGDSGGPLLNQQWLCERLNAASAGYFVIYVDRPRALPQRRPAGHDHRRRNSG
jgi:hypothetical protein